MKINNKQCTTCGNRLTGRSDKKFCSTHCRNISNNKKKENPLKTVISVTNKTIENRRILIQLHNQQKVQLTRFDLLELGFDFRYFTNIIELKNGSTLFYVYDYLYQVYSDQQIIIFPLAHPTRRTFKNEIMF